MKRLTFDGNFCDIAKCADVCEGIICEEEACSQRKTWERLKAIEDILGDGYNLDRLQVIMDQRMSLRDEVAERFKLTANIPVYKLKILIDAINDGRCEVFDLKIGQKAFLLDKDAGEINERKIYGITMCEDDEIYYWTLEDDDEPFEVEDIGKTVFLTRVAAEKALEEMEEKGNG